MIRKNFRTGVSSYVTAITAVLLVSLSSLQARPLPLAEAQQAETQPRKVVLLGFDGLDAGLTKRFMEEGHLPRFRELSEKGTFLPLGTTNPAQSPTAWGSIVTGLNPGKTNLGGFIRRTCRGIVMPTVSMAEDSFKGDRHTKPWSEFSWINKESQWLLIGAGALVVLVLVFFLLKSAAGAKTGLSLVAGLILAAAASVLGFFFFDGLPEEVPIPYNMQQGDFVWDVLAENGVDCIGLYVPGAYPCLASDKSRILGGLGVPDISGGGTGSWYVYTDDDWIIHDQETRTAGKIIKLREKDGLIRGPLFGPKNFVEMEEFEKRIDALREKESKRELDVVKREYREWKGDNRKKKALVEFSIDPDRSTGKAVITVQDQAQALSVGDWSEWFRVSFALSPRVEVPALVRMRLIRCDEEQIRIFIPAIDISPEGTPEYFRISSPGDYAERLSREAGLFETVGWSCITHGLKDEEIDEFVFLEDIEFTMKNREKVMKSQLDSGDFDLLMSVFYSPDRVQHMMYRLFDKDHHQHDAALADRTMTFFGREIRLGDAILEIYKRADRIVGEMVDRINSGALGKNAVLMVVSDHGFAPFYSGMNLNNYLVEKGYMSLARGGIPVKVDEINNLKDANFLRLVDWEKTQAYSVGLGKVYINLAGREPAGIVEPSEYEEVRDRIIGDLEAYIDPASARKVISKAFKREEIFTGPFWKEGKALFRFNHGADVEEREISGFADIFIGFHRGFRVSWGTSMGGLDEDVIVPNNLRWSGDHVSVMPDDVQGIFLSNVPDKVGKGRLSVMDIVPTIYGLFGVDVPGPVDGKSIPLVF